ncbi:Phosphatidate cytidylyltransferase (CDP-diglyceride pyrophosphorylase) (CDP-diglyceride synthetase) (CDP-diacylglycerol synthase) (CDS) (CTP:phosphatidate cytidylyltransferase) (CDP-DG synthetase) (CDP-DAG synthase) [Bartonella clarridgeiae 73]|uniref:Phosphatidate cytidylyltransferase n=1 Tax=Bartonella clarridgeiae (strain CCUG 45776 / CIP 104772 / 73) TaxID=696125 RepID=E6YI70_BARC7|nr:phosphatidate cytidylyltransferase [Bartonella clarridgeiae]CBI76558.1 Phosphatidate cytidylyltransferase (CDP-diglyceride pyrophosphorylase) (CDP-diglyceride synthetase) (CDP-diacylglycerol synthase) (CDS) (CTP:phosphatidate cytidylyltransferase) (CDP-DG synthetase) (CDP-DAG synthase) [Bartonella clarridgeiae 73]
MSNLISRILTAIVFGTIALYLTWCGGILFFLFTWGIGGFILYEWINITEEKWNVLQKILAGIFYFVFGSFLVFSTSAPLIFCVVMALAVLLAFTSIRNVGWISGGFVYASFPVVALSFLRGYDLLGFWGVIFLFAIVWTTDIAAYFSGRAFGGPKLAPRFSPNKTWAGAIVGTLAGFSSGIVVIVYVFGVSALDYFVFLIALILSVISQIGDLGQSWLKRRFSIKDSGFLLPGHGGFMDRMDGLICATLLFYIIGSFMFDMNTPLVFSIRLY